jgi:hypothetical protein
MQDACVSVLIQAFCFWRVSAYCGPGKPQRHAAGAHVENAGIDAKERRSGAMPAQ